MYVAVQQPFDPVVVVSGTSDQRGRASDQGRKDVRRFVSAAGEMGKDNASSAADEIGGSRPCFSIKSSNGDREFWSQSRRSANVHVSAAGRFRRLRAHGCPPRMHAE